MLITLLSVQLSADIPNATTATTPPKCLVPPSEAKHEVAALARGRVFCGTRKTHRSAHMAKRVGKRIRVENTAGLGQRESSRGVVLSLRLERFTEVKRTLCVAGF